MWAAVSKEALSVIFDKADPTGLEDDARLTLIWFWVLKAAANGGPTESTPDTDEGDDSEDDELDMPARNGKQGFAMEFDAARKLAQGLGVDLLQLGRPGGILKISGNISMLFRVSQREPYLIGRQLALFGDESKPRKRERRPKDPSLEMKSVPMRQEHLFAEEPPPELDLEQPMIPGLIFPQDDRTNLQRLIDSGQTMLDRLHQAMLLFGRDQIGLLRPLLIETGMATDNRFWLLAQSLSALYPSGTDEKRWVDGVLARKKGLGL